MRDLRNDMMTRTRLFVLARACHAQGHVQLAHQVMSCTIAIPDDETGKRLSIDQFQKKIVDDISHAETCAASSLLAIRWSVAKSCSDDFAGLQCTFPRTGTGNE